MGTVLVQPGSQTDRIVEDQPEYLLRVGRWPTTEQRIGAGAIGRLDGQQGQMVSALGIEGEQQRSGEGVHGFWFR